jgi:hypothetical protein
MAYPRAPLNAGDRFGMLTVIRETDPERHAPPMSPTYHRRVLCVCDCGRMTNTRLRSLRSGQTKSCGCLVVVKLRQMNAQRPRKSL